MLMMVRYRDYYCFFIFCCHLMKAFLAAFIFYISLFLFTHKCGDKGNFHGFAKIINAQKAQGLEVFGEGKGAVILFYIN